MRRSLLVAIATSAVMALAVGCSTANPTAPEAAAVAGGQYTPAAATEPPAGTAPSIVTATGTGKVTTVPDVMTIVVGVQTQAASAKDALDQNGTLAAGVISTLKTSGVAPADLQTNQLSVYPTYADNTVITGYQVTNTLTATVRDISSGGALIDAVTQQAGDAVRIQQIGFSISDDTAVRAAARTAAVQQAQAQAQELADAAGVHLGAVLSITESSSVSPMPYYAAADSAAAPIEAGTQDVSISVQVVYEIQQ